VKWRVIASGAILGLFFIPWVFGQFVNAVFMTHWGNVVSPLALMISISNGLFGFGFYNRVVDTLRIEDFDGNVRQVVVTEPPLWLCWAIMFLICAICLALLSRKVRAYEVVR
jgi:hypothetical protein